MTHVVDFDPEDFDPDYKCPCPMCKVYRKQEEDEDNVQNAG